MNQINIGLFGFGTVGQGIYRVIGRAKNAHAQVKRICVRNVAKPREVAVDPALLTDRATDILDDPEINLIVEVVDSADASYSIVTEALRRGIPVVSGNKAMIARHLPELIELVQNYPDCRALTLKKFQLFTQTLPQERFDACVKALTALN